MTPIRAVSKDGDGGKEGLSEAPAPTAAPETPTSASADQAALDAYRRAGQAFEEAPSTADPGTPSLALSTTGELALAAALVLVVALGAVVLALQRIGRADVVRNGGDVGMGQSGDLLGEVGPVWS